MTKTTNYQLNKPELTDPVRVDDFNENAEIIDGLLASLTTAVNTEHITVGSYTGDGTTGRAIALPFVPKAVLLFVRFGSNAAYTQVYVLADGFHFFFSDSALGFTTVNECALLEKGFQVGGTATNYKDMTNHYIAFG